METHIKAWLSRNAVGVLIALLAANFLIVYWSTLNWGIFGARNSLLGLDPLRSRKLTLQEQAQALDAARPGADVAARRAVVSSPDLRLTCSDDDLASAFASVMPAVVNITAEKVTQRKGGTMASSVAFDDPAITFVQEQSLGSGIIVDPRGYILTNAHVVSKAQNVKAVVFGFERRAYTAEIIRKDLANDIAVLKIQPDGPLPTAVLGDSDMIKVADRVLTVGSPFGLEHTVTAGIISDDSRNLVVEGQTYEDMIQTDAAINRGNSGGPLVNVKGEVIGMNTAIYAPTGVFTGIGFAIPINRVKPIMNQILAK